VNRGAPASGRPTDARLLDLLRSSFGFDAFRPHQQEIVRAILDGRDVFAALPTGGGKSLCYQLPALVREGLALVVSPLISLMKDQVDGAREDGIAAAFLNSSLDEEEARATWRDLASGRVRLLYASPERLALPDFRAALRRFGVSLVAVDEAHCISEWGHEFRPDYRSLGLLRGAFPGVPMAAFTATATRQVQDDVVRQLGLRSPLVVRASFDRPELFYRVAPKDGDADAQVLEFIRCHPGQSGIVYRSTRKAVERTAGYLAGRGVSVAAYHAGMEDTERRERQEAFVSDEVPVVVATIAFGMGIDKPNVRWVVHADLPRSLEGYYQETGRAARDGENADTLLLYGPADLATAHWRIDQAPSPAERRRAEDRLAAMLRYVESGSCRRVTLLAHFDERHPGSCGRCDVCAGEVVTEDLTESARLVLSAARYTGERFGAHHLADILVGAATDKVLERGHQHLPVFGAGRDRERGAWLDLVRALEAADLVVRGEGRTAGYALTGQGRLLLAGRRVFTGPRHLAGAGEEPSAREQPAGSAPDDAGREALFQHLRGVRLAIARTKKLPPYVIFADRTLRDMARLQPTDPAGLRRCHGVGDAKLGAYGRDFLAQIRWWKEGRHGQG
jgi:ATP-dependent DNA helicase RecQ